MYKIAKENNMFAVINSDNFVVAVFENKLAADNYVKASNLVHEQHNVLHSYNCQDLDKELLAEALKEF